MTTADKINIKFENERATWEQDGFRLKARIVEDESPDFSWLGTFSNKPGPGAIEHEPENHRTYNWFNPAEQDDAEYARAAYERACKFGDDWFMLGVIVEAYKPNVGVVLGHASVWSVESDSGEEHFAELAQECAHEAIREAQETLDKLCNS